MFQIGPREIGADLAFGVDLALFILQCILTETFDRFVGNDCLEISRCYSESILMKVSDIIMHIIEIT